MSLEDEFVFENNDLPDKIFNFYEDMRRKGKLLDITFKVGSDSISAHRIVLAAGIPYFRDKICIDDPTETTECDIEIPEMDPCAFRALVEYVYSCKIMITVDNVENLLSVACALNVEEVKDACCQFLEDRLTPEMLLDTRQLARRLGCSSLVEKADYHIRKHFEKIVQSESFLSLPSTDLKDIISNDDLNVANEEKVFEAIMLWVQKFPSERRFELPELLRNVRMTFLSPRYLWDYVAQQELIRISIPCRDLVDEAKSYHLFPEKREGLPAFCTTKRHFVDKELKGTSYSVKNDSKSIPSSVKNDDVGFRRALKSLDRMVPEECNYKAIGKTICTLERFDSDKMKWSTCGNKNVKHKKADGKESNICNIEVKTEVSVTCCDSMEHELGTCAKTTLFHDNGIVVELNAKVYIIYEKSTLEYDRSTNEIKVFKGCGRRHGGAVVLGDDIYVFGGTGSYFYSSEPNSVRKFNSNRKEWSNFSNLRSSREYPGVVSFEGCVYIIGGKRKQNVYRGLEIYNIKLNCTNTDISMLTRRYALGSAVLNGKIYVCGGKSESHECLSSAEVFNPEQGRWDFIADMNTPRCMFNLLRYNGKLYAIGGQDDSGNSVNTIDIYNPETNKWVIEVPTNSKIKVPAPVVLHET